MLDTQSLIWPLLTKDTLRVGGKIQFMRDSELCEGVLTIIAITHKRHLVFDQPVPSGIMPHDIIVKVNV